MEGEEESQFSDAPSMGLHTDMECEVGEESKEPIGSEEEVSGQTSPGEGAEASLHIDQCQHSWKWESIMEESVGLAYDDPCSSSDTTVTGVDSPSVPPLSSCDESGGSPPTRLRGSTPCLLGSPMEEMLPLVPAVAMPASGTDTVEVHISQSELDNLQSGGPHLGLTWMCQNCSQRHEKMEDGGICNIFLIYFEIKDSCHCYIECR